MKVWTEIACEAALVALLAAVDADPADAEAGEASAHRALAALIYGRVAEHVANRSSPAKVQADLEILDRTMWQAWRRWRHEHPGDLPDWKRFAWWLRSQQRIADHARILARRLDTGRRSPPT